MRADLTMEVLNAFSCLPTTAEQNKDQPKRRRAALLNRENALVMRQSPRWLQFFASLMVAIGSGMLVTGYLVKIDEVVTATGLLQASSGKTELKTPAGGKVADVLVKNGDLVRQGQMLVRFDTTLARERRDTAESLVRLERDSLKRQLAGLETQRATLEQRLRTQSTITAEYGDLLNSGGMAKLQYLKEKDSEFELRSRISILNDQVRQSQIDAEKRIRQLQSQIEEANLQLRYQNVVAPTGGVVFDLKAQTAGVIQPGEAILSLIPNQGLSAEVFVPNRDIGFIKVGQQAKVRVDAFPSSRYGELDGAVALVGADALPPDNTANFYRFPVRIDLNKPYLETGGVKIPLRSGMSITSNLQIRQKRMITLVSDFFSGQLESIKSLRQ